MTLKQIEVALIKTAAILFKGEIFVPCREEDLPKTTPKSVINALRQQHYNTREIGIHLSELASHLREYDED